MPVAVRRIDPSEVEAWVRCTMLPFLETPSEDSTRHWAGHVEPDRTWAVVDGGRFVGNACVFSRDITLPGASGGPAPTVPLAAVSGVGVHPTHRRQGLLGRLMGAMMADGLERGEPVAALLASEAPIYGRFGYGWATTVVDWRIERLKTRFAGPVPSPRFIVGGADEAAERLPLLFDRLRPLDRPGQVSRNAPAWRDLWADPADRRPAGTSGAFFVIGDDGYARYRARNDWPMPGRVTLYVEEVMAADADVDAALWRYLFDIDLIDDIVARERPPDEPVRWRLADPRALETTGAADFLWVRILDVPAAFTARRYHREEQLVLEVEAAPAWAGPDGQPAPDPAAGRWVLETGLEGATCRPARRTERADVRLGAADLGAVLLGGQDLAGRAAAGRVVEERAGGLARADGLFAVRPLPFSATGF